MKATPLTTYTCSGGGGAFGVEIRDVDLTHLDEEAFNAIRSTWMQHGVAVFPGQSFDDDALASFAARHGELFVHAQTSLLSSKHRQIMELSNLPDAERRTVHSLDWHTDQSYTPRPVFGTMLYGVVASVTGGETHFADLAGAYATLPPDLRLELDGVTAVYSAEPRPDIREKPLTAEERARIVDCTHPLVRTHPYLRNRSLYLSPLHMARIGDLDETDSLDLIERLVDHATQPQHVYRHRWTAGDLVMWDNARVMHRRTPFPPDEPRHLKRAGFYFPEALGVPV